jgi:hypothetical protein
MDSPFGVAWSVETGLWVGWSHSYNGDKTLALAFASGMDGVSNPGN